MPNSQHRRFVGLDDWKADAKAQKASADVALRKSFAGVFKADGDSATAPIRIRITTAQRDRDRDTVAASGWKLDNYLKNPVVLWAHDYRSFPIARDTGLTIDAEGLTGTPQFATEDENPWAPYCERLIRGGFLNAASVGFAPLSWSYNEEERGVDFQEAELLEYSIVPVPSNPGALVEARGAGIEIGWIAEWAEKALDEWHGASGLWVPRQAVEQARVIAGRKGLVMLVPKAGTKQWDVVALKEEAPAAAETPAAANEGTSTDGQAADGAADASANTDSSKDGENADANADSASEDVLELDDAASAEDEVLVLDEDSKTIDIDEAELRELVRSTLKESLGPALTALTGRID